MKKLLTTTILTLAIGVVPVLAQNTAPAVPAKPINMGDLRHHIYVMEGALARAVDYGAKQLNREILQAMPGVFMLEGEARARGVHLDGYGVFFDVRVPMMRQSMVWSLRMMFDQDNARTQATIDELRKSMQGITDASTRAALERAVKQLEARSAGPMPRNPGPNVVAPGIVMPESATPPGVGASNAVGVTANSVPPRPAPAPSAAADSLWAKDPNRAYTEAVTRALVDAMIDYSAPMQIGPEQWLTVAARDDEGRDSLAPPDPLEEIVTMIYRIKGSDLHEYRQGRIDRDEVRRRVQLSQF